MITAAPLLSQDDPRLVDYNVQERLEAFVSECDKLFNVTRGNDVMLTMGSDFTVRLARSQTLPTPCSMLDG